MHAITPPQKQLALKKGKKILLVENLQSIPPAQLNAPCADGQLMHSNRRQRTGIFTATFNVRKRYKTAKSFSSRSQDFCVLFFGRCILRATATAQSIRTHGAVGAQSEDTLLAPKALQLLVSYTAGAKRGSSPSSSIFKTHKTKLLLGPNESGLFIQETTSALGLLL